MAKPTKYTPELIETAWRYIEQYREHDDAFPSVVGLAKVLGVTRRVLHMWTHDAEKEEWRELMDTLSSEQERVCLNNGIRGNFNPVITKLVLAKHGYHDKAAVEHSGPDGGPIKQITTEMSAEEATRLYQENLRG